MSMELKVNGLRWFGPDIYEVRLSREDIEFVPGDCMALFAADGVASRPYSIASGTDEEDLAFVIRRMPGGEVSPHVASLAPGDTVKASPPFGWFRPGSAELTDDFVFIATGTGISPFLAHCRSFPGRPPRQVFYGVRRHEDAVALDELDRAAASLTLAISREEVPGTHHGRVTDLLGELPEEEGVHFFLCGLDAMIDDVSDFLEERGVALQRIHRECFFNADYE